MFVGDFCLFVFIYFLYSKYFHIFTDLHKSLKTNQNQRVKLNSSDQK